MTKMVSGGCSIIETSRKSDYPTRYINRVDGSFKQHPHANPKTRLPVYASFPSIFSLFFPSPSITVRVFSHYYGFIRRESLSGVWYIGPSSLHSFNCCSSCRLVFVRLPQLVLWFVEGFIAKIPAPSLQLLGTVQSMLRRFPLKS